MNRIDFTPEYSRTIYCGLSATRSHHLTPRRCSASPLGLDFGLSTLILPRHDVSRTIRATTSAVGAGPARRISHWPAPGYPNAGGARLATPVRRQGGIIVTGKAGFPEFLKLTARQKAVRVTDSQRFEERDCRVGSPYGYGRRCIGAIQASQRVATKTRAFHFSHIAQETATGHRTLA